MKELPSLVSIKSILKISTPSFQKVFFELRDLIRTPQAQWTTEQRKWWSSLNIIIGQIESDSLQQTPKQRRNKK